MATAKVALAANGYAVLPALLPALQLRALQRYCRAVVDEGHVRFGDRQVPDRWAQHNEPIARWLLTASTAIVAACAGMRLKPAYAYFACYRAGAALAVHRDRAQCELSVSFLVDYEPRPDGPSSWPLWMSHRAEGPGAAIQQSIGDAILYRGCELYHWRDALPAGHRSTHVFLHYVPSNFTGSLA